MNSKDFEKLTIGRTYRVAVGRNTTHATIIAKLEDGGWEARSMKSGKTLRVRSHGSIDELAPDAKLAKKASKRAKASPSRDTGKPAATSGKRMSLLDAAAHLLAGSKEPMSCQTMVNIALAQGLWAPKREGKTPANTLYSAILREVKTKGADSRFEKVARGKFALAKK